MSKRRISNSWAIFTESSSGGAPLSNPSILKRALKDSEPIPLVTFSAGYQVEDDHDGECAIRYESELPPRCSFP